MKQCKEGCDVEKFVKKSLNLEEVRITKKQVTQIKENVEVHVQQNITIEKRE